MANPLKFAQLGRTLQAKVEFPIESSKGNNSSLTLVFDGPCRKVTISFREEDGGETLRLWATSDQNDTMNLAYPWTMSSEMYVVNLASEFIAYLNME